MFSQLSVKQKLLGGFTLVIMLLFILLAVAIFNMKIINSKIMDMTQDRYPKISLVNSITVKSMDMGRQIRNAVMFANENADEYVSKVTNLDKSQDEDLAKIAPMLSTEKGKAMFAKLQEQNLALTAALEQVYP